MSKAKTSKLWMRAKDIVKLRKKKKAAPVPTEATTQEAIQKLRECKAMLENKSKQELVTAKKTRRTNKKVALAALRKKKRSDNQLKLIEETEARFKIQPSQGATSLETSNYRLEVCDLMDEIYKQQDIANKIANAISNPVGFGQDEHEADLLEELEALGREQGDGEPPL